MTETPTESYLRVYFSMEVIKMPKRHSSLQKPLDILMPKRHSSLRKPLDILTISKAKSNLRLKMIRTKKSFRELKHYRLFGNTLQHQKQHHIKIGSPSCKASK